MKSIHSLTLFTLLALSAFVHAQPPAPTIVDEASGPDCPCGVNYTVWGRAEGLFWWTKRGPVPPLVTASPAGTDRAAAGLLATPGTRVLFGGSDLDYDMRSGGRFAFGVWGDTCTSSGLEVTGFFLEQGTIGFLGNSAANPVLARPFFDASRQRPDAELVAFPNVLSGTVQVNSSSRFFGNEVSLRSNVFCGGRIRVDGLCGYRFMYLREGLDVVENLTNVDPGGLVPTGTTFRVQDSFGAKNSFNGANFGLILQTQTGPVLLDLSAKLAVGATHHDVEVGGFTRTQTPGTAPITRSGGLLAQSTNAGNYGGAVGSVIPEFGANLRWAVTERIVVQAGYTLLYWTEVARPGDQVDVTVNRTGIPPGTLSGPARPTFHLDLSDFWAHGLNCGFEFRF